MKRDSFLIEIEQGHEYTIGKNFPLGKKRIQIDVKLLLE